MALGMAEFVPDLRLAIFGIDVGCGTDGVQVSPLFGDMWALTRALHRDVVWHPTPDPRAPTVVDANRVLTAADAAPQQLDQVALDPRARRYAAPSDLRRIESRAVPVRSPRWRLRPRRPLIAGAQRR